MLCLHISTNPKRYKAQPCSALLINRPSFLPSATMILKHSERATPDYAKDGGHWLKEYTSSASAVHGKGIEGHDTEDPEPSSEPPPAYSSSPSTYSPSADVNISDHQLALLCAFDTVFLVDDSTTMKEVDKRGFLQRGSSKTRWELVNTSFLLCHLAL